MTINLVRDIIGGASGTSATSLVSGLLRPIVGIGEQDGGIDVSILDLDGNGDGLVDAGILGNNGVVQVDALGGVVQASLLDPDGDGLVSIELLDGTIDASVLDPDGDGLVSVDVLDTIGVDVAGPTDPGDGPTPGGPTGPTDPSAYTRQLLGTAGQDSFLIQSERTYVDGRADVDTVSYAAASGGFSYAIAATGVFVGNGTKVDYLQNVERVSFTDGTLVLDTGLGENGGVGYRLYQAAFDRTPDDTGLRYWIGELDEGTPLHDVAQGFLDSVEFQTTYGSNLTDRAFVQALYENVLQRQGESAGLDFWVDRLASGTFDRATVLAGFSESNENVALVGATIEGGFFLG